MYPKGSKGACDKLFSKIVRARGACEHCGSTNNLQCAHIVSRRFSATRCLESNVYCLCAKCHMRFTEWPREFSHFITGTIGSAAYDELRRLAETPTKVNWDDTLRDLKERAKELGLAL